MSVRWWHIFGLLILGYVIGWWYPKLGNTAGLSKVLTPMS